MAQQSAGSGYDHVGTQLQALHLLVISVSVIAAIHGNAAHPVKVITETLHGLVYLLGELARWRHHNAIDGVLRIAPVIKHAEYWEQVGGCLARACLRHSYDVVLVKNLRYALLLYWCTFVKMHVVKRIQYVIVQISFFKSH